MSFWHRLAIAAAVFACVTLLARLVDWRLARKPLAAEAVTRYRVLRRSVTTSILFVGFFSALLVIPQVRAVAGGLLASSAVLGVIIGFASQRTLGNFVAGLLIAIAQPVRLGDRVVYGGEAGEQRDAREDRGRDCEAMPEGHTASFDERGPDPQSSGSGCRPAKPSSTACQ